MGVSDPDRGVVYIATQDPYLDEAVTSARSIREFHPELPITLFAPDTHDPPAGVFDSVVRVTNPTHGFSDSNLTDDHFPYERNLFLDTDTYVCGELDSVFELLERSDLAAAQDPTRNGTAEHSHDHDVPASFPQFNTGVIAYRDTARVRELFKRWNDLFHTVDGVLAGLNQPTFRMAAYESDLNIGTLPPEYNFRIGVYANAVAYACGPVRILHGRSSYWEPEDMADRLNRTHERRVVIAKPWPPQVITDRDGTTTQEMTRKLDRANWKLTRDGVAGLGKLCYGMAKGVLT